MATQITMRLYPIILFRHSSINPFASSFEKATNTTEQTAKQALPGTFESNTIAITAQPNIKGLVGFGGVGWVVGSEYCG